VILLDNLNECGTHLAALGFSLMGLLLEASLLGYLSNFASPCAADLKWFGVLLWRKVIK